MLLTYRRQMALGLASVRVGCWTDAEAGTGVTVVLPPSGTLGAMAVRGGAPGTREAAALGPTGSGVECHAVALCGSSVFGLAAVDGVVDWCRRTGIGLRLAGTHVPVVAGMVVFDLRGSDDDPVDRAMPTPSSGIAACEAATTDDPPSGRVGVGTGCTAAKIAGRGHSVPGGQGSAVVRQGDLVVSALMAVNPVGEVIDQDGSVLAGTTAPADAPRFPEVPMSELSAWDEARGNTVIGCVVTNARLDKAQAHRCADLAHGGIVRSVQPAHTSMDGDAITLLALGEVEASIDQVVSMAVDAVAEAVRDAVR